MPSLQVVSSSLSNESTSSFASDILQHHSINSLLNQHDILSSESESETMSVTDLFGLNSPRGLLDFANWSSNGLCTPPAAAHNLQLDFDDAKFQSPAASSTSNKLNLSLNGSFYGAHPVRSSSVGSDYCGNSPVLEQTLLAGITNSRSNSPESDSSGVDGNLSDILNSLTLNETPARSLIRNNVDNLQNLQAVHALKYLQHPSNVLGSISPLTYSLPSHHSLLNKSLQLDIAARTHRTAASFYEATYTWSGVLPPRTTKPSGYSSKVFLGGVPWDISEQALVQTFKQFGPVRVEWPGKEKQISQPKGYVYVIFESEKNVKALLQACTSDYSNNGSNWFYKISSKRMKAKEVQVIPWFLNDSNYTKSTTQKLDPSKTVFVGALHGMLNAEGLAKIMNDLFDGVIYTGIDTDKHKYPIGSGRVTFSNPTSYLKAVAAAFIELKTSKFSKKVQVDPYLEDSPCSVCGVQQGPYFCRDIFCFRYFCRICWQWQHNSEIRHHKPLMRNSKNGVGVPLGSGGTTGNNGRTNEPSSLW